MTDKRFDESIDALQSALSEMRGDGRENVVAGLRLIRAFLKLNQADRDRIIGLAERLSD